MSNVFINPDKNDSFSLLRGLDLQELLVEVENYFLEYRKLINLPHDVTFGIEIEYEGVLKKRVDRFVENNFDTWKSKTDASLKSGGELNSPIMKDELHYWKELKKICQYLTEIGADTLHNAGGHIHIGTCVLGDDVEAWKNFLKLYMAYESVLFRFVYGDKISGRKGIYKYAPPVADILYSEISEINSACSISDIICTLPRGRRMALNFSHVLFMDFKEKYEKNTLEFRSPNSTTNEVVWQNNINAFTKMLASSRDKVMNEEFLDYKLKYEYVPYSGNEYMYNEVNLKNALEFVDLVFDNNLDKVYFLRQYLKGFQENHGIKTAVKAKRFVK